MGMFGKKSNRVAPDVAHNEVPVSQGGKKKKTAFWKKICNGGDVIDSQTKMRDFGEELYETRMAIAKEREIALDKRENSYEVRLKLLIEREKSMKDKEREFRKGERKRLAKSKNKEVQVDIGKNSVPDINKNPLDGTIPKVGRLLPPLHLADEKMTADKKKGKKKSKKVKTEKDVGEKINTKSSSKVKQDVGVKEKKEIKVQGNQQNQEEDKGNNGRNTNVKPKAVANVETPAAKIQVTSDSETDDDDLIVCKRLKWPAKDYITVADEHKPSTGTDDTIDKVDKVRNCSSEEEKTHVEDNDEQGDGDTAKAETIAEQNQIYDQIKEILSKLIHDGKSIKQILTSGGDTSNNHQVLAHTDNMMAYFEDVSPLIEQIQEVNVYDRIDSLFEVIYLTTEDITLKSNALARLQNWNGQNCTSLLWQIEKASDVIINTGAKIAGLLVPVDY